MDYEAVAQQNDRRAEGHCAFNALGALYAPGTCNDARAALLSRARLEKWPKELTYSLEQVSKPVYNSMNGPNEFTILGNIRYWDVTDKLASIVIPTLVLTGEYSEVSPKVGRAIHRNIRVLKLMMFPGCSHTPFWENRDAFIKVVSRFLARN